jgi:hypothetical protein
VTGISQLSASHVIERMLLQNAIMFPRLAFSPTRRKRRKQFDLSAKAEPATILYLDPVGQLVSERHVMRDTLENAEKQLVKIVGGKSLALLTPLDNNKMVAPRINFDVWAGQVLAMAVRRQRMVSRCSN